MSNLLFQFVLAAKEAEFGSDIEESINSFSNWLIGIGIAFCLVGFIIGGVKYGLPMKDDGSDGKQGMIRACIAAFCIGAASIIIGVFTKLSGID